MEKSITSINNPRPVFPNCGGLNLCIPLQGPQIKLWCGGSLYTTERSTDFSNSQEMPTTYSYFISHFCT